MVWINQILIATIISCLALGNIPAKAGENHPGSSQKRRLNKGDEVAMRFSCWLKTGELVASSYTQEHFGPDAPKSPVYLPRDRNDPLVIRAGHGLENIDEVPSRSFEGEILVQLARGVVGLPADGNQTLEISSAPGAADQADNVLQVARVRQRVKEMSMTPKEYEAMRGEAPEVGKTYTVDPAFPGRIVSVSSDRVLIAFASPPDDTVGTPFGPGKVRELPDRYEIDIDAHESTLVRTGSLVGRIVGVDAHKITLDYSYPFGGEVLVCDVKLASAVPSTDTPMVKKGE